MAEREFRTTPQWPIATTPLSGDELVEIWKDGKQYYVPFSELGGIPAAHQGSHQRGGSDAVGTLDNDAYGIPYLDADGTIDTRVSDASTTKKGKVQLATDGEESAKKAVTGTDARLSDARAPTAHAEQHIAGTDVIADATVSNSGLMSAADKGKADATIPGYIPTADQKAALVGTSGTPGAGNKYVTNSDGRLPTAGEKAALVGTSGTPGEANRFVTTTDPRLAGGGGDGTTDALVRAWASFFSVFSEEQPTGQTSRGLYALASHDGDLYATVFAGDIYKMDGAGIFQPTGQALIGWWGIASHGGDLYATVFAGDIYKMDGAGIFQPTGQTSINWRGLASHDGDLYAADYGGDIYKMDGAGIFQPTGQALIGWFGLASHDGDLYATVSGGDIYKMDGAGIFQPTGQALIGWFGLASHDGDLYATVSGGDIYKMDGSGVFQATGQTTRNWWGIASHGGDLYAADYDGDIYLLTTSNPSVNISKSNYTVPISSSFPTNGRKVYRRTSAYDGNPVTITPPSGATFEGLASIDLYGQYSYVELERISATVFAIKDLKGFTFRASSSLPATPTSVTKIIKIATVDFRYTGTVNIVSSGYGIEDGVKIYINGGDSRNSGLRVVYGKNNTTWGIKKIIVSADTPTLNSPRQIYAEIETYANNPSTTSLGVVETNAGTFTPSMVEVSSVEGTVLDSLPLNYQRGDISSYQHVFTKNIIGNLTGNAASALVTDKIHFGTKSGTSTGVQGQASFDASYLYLCTATNVWKRVALTSF